MRLRVVCAKCKEKDAAWAPGQGDLALGECVEALLLRRWLVHGRDWYCPACARAARLAAESQVSPATKGG